MREPLAPSRIAVSFATRSPGWTFMATRPSWWNGGSKFSRSERQTVILQSRRARLIVADGAGGGVARTGRRRDKDRWDRWERRVGKDNVFPTDLPDSPDLPDFGYPFFLSNSCMNDTRVSTPA